MRLNIVVYAPLRVLSQLENIVREVARVYGSTCRLEATVIPYPEPNAHPFVVLEGSPFCASLVEDIIALAIGAVQVIRRGLFEEQQAIPISVNASVYYAEVMT